MEQLLEELKEYLRIDGDDEDRSLKAFLQMAISTLINAGVKQPRDYFLKIEEKDVFALHRLAVMMLATHYYENRIAYNTGNRVLNNNVPYGLQYIILQLKWVDPDELSAQQ